MSFGSPGLAADAALAALMSPQVASTSDVLASLMAARRSCRAFHAEQLPQDSIVRALEIAQQTASWCNCQPWNVIVTSGEATERFRRAYVQRVGAGDIAAQAPESDFPFPAQYEGVYHERQRAAGSVYYSAVGIRSDDRHASGRQVLQNFALFGAPHFMLVTVPRALGVYGALDCGAYVHNFMLAAKSLGFGAIAQGAIAMFSPFVRQHFGLSDDWMVVCGVSFGRPDDDAPANKFRTARAPISENVTFLTA